MINRPFVLFIIITLGVCTGHLLRDGIVAVSAALSIKYAVEEMTSALGKVALIRLPLPRKRRLIGESSRIVRLA